MGTYKSKTNKILFRCLTVFKTLTLGKNYFITVNWATVSNIISLTNKYAVLLVGFHTVQQILTHKPLQKSNAQAAELIRFHFLAGWMEKQTCAAHSSLWTSFISQALSTARDSQPHHFHGSISFWKKPALLIARPVLDLYGHCEKWISFPKFPNLRWEPICPFTLRTIYATCELVPVFGF